MGIGTSLGAYFEDGFNHAAGVQAPDAEVLKPKDTGDDNVLPPDNYEVGGGNKSDILQIAEKQVASDGQKYNEDDGYTNFFNTPIANQDQYQDWMTKNGKTTNDHYDYDLQGAFKGGANPSENGHLPDTYKKPNHITFSDQSQYNGAGYWNPTSGALEEHAEGGKWDDIGDGKYSFTPGKTNLQFHSTQELKDYFDKYEKGNKLILPGQ